MPLSPLAGLLCLLLACFAWSCGTEGADQSAPSKRDAGSTGSMSDGGGVDHVNRTDAGEANADADRDGDDVPDNLDNCPDVTNRGQANLDEDSQGDACDDDDDGDGVADLFDNCPSSPNGSQQDTDGDTQGDACDADDDQDGHLDLTDNCPSVANADQANADADTLGDACDGNDDGDARTDDLDNCPLTANDDQKDSDLNGMGDACEPEGICRAKPTCPDATSLGTVSANTGGASLSAQGTGPRFLRVLASEAESLSASRTAGLSISLQAPSATRYSLHVYGVEANACSTLDLSVLVPEGETRTLEPVWDARASQAASRGLTVEVRFVSGTCSGAWQLDVSGDPCPYPSFLDTSVCPDSTRTRDEAATAGHDGEGVVACGATSACGIGANACCTTSTGVSSCVALDPTAAPGWTCAQEEITCDGPEDCVGAQVCCVDAPAGGAKSATCASVCQGATTSLACHVDADCGAPATCKQGLCVGTGDDVLTPGNDTSTATACGGTSACLYGNQSCCISALGGDSTACVQGLTCPAVGGGATPSRVACDGSEDCPSDEICCAAVNPSGATVSCQSSCADVSGLIGVWQVCHVDSDCPAERPSCDSASTFPFWGFCT